VNILIIGGLLGLAVVAILGAVLLGIGEDRAEKASGAAPALLPQQSQSMQQEEPVAAPQTVPLTPFITSTTGQLPALNQDEQFASLNGQMHEITSELRALAQRAGELEQRLSVLSEVLERHQTPAHPSGQLYAPEADAPAL
jgi:hypothetical protein